MNLIILTGLLIFCVLLAILLKQIPQTSSDPETFLDEDGLGLTNFINNDIIQYTTRQSDNNYAEKLKNVLINKKQSLANIIKYTDDNMAWSIWKKPTEFKDQTKLSELSTYLFYAIQQKLLSENIQILYYKLNKLRQSKNALLFENDFVFYKTRDIYAYHVNIISAIEDKKIHILYINMIGNINEDKLNNVMYAASYASYASYASTTSNANNSLDYSTFITDTINPINDSVAQFDSFKSLKTQDQDVANILYKKIVDTGDSLQYNEDYKKNIEYTYNQNIIRNAFLKNLHKTDTEIDSTNIYKNYPYGNDFRVL